MQKVWRERTQFTALVALGLMLLAAFGPKALALAFVGLAAAFAGLSLYALWRYRQTLTEGADE